jgi:outer membrane murein-binding lipoprotein Lpp
MYVGGGAQGSIDWLARKKIEQQAKDIAELQAQVAELTAALKARDEADYKHLDLAGRWT